MASFIPNGCKRMRGADQMADQVSEVADSSKPETSHGHDVIADEADVAVFPSDPTETQSERPPTELADVEAPPLAKPMNKAATKATDKALLEACENGNLVKVQELLEAKADIHGVDQRKQTPFHLAAREGHLDIVKFLFEAGSDIHAKNVAKTTPLHMASFMGRIDTIKFLLDKGADRSLKDNGGAIPFHLATFCGHLETLKLLLADGAKDQVNSANSEYSTPIITAATQNHTEVAKWLLNEVGADLRAKNDNKHTALHMAAFNGNLELVKLFVGTDASDINLQNVEYGWSAIFWASIQDQTETAKWLASQETCDLALRDHCKRTLLHVVVRGRNATLLEFFLDKEVIDLEARTDEDDTALHLAAGAGVLECAKLLVAKGADVNAVTSEGKTPMHTAVQERKYAVLQFLCEKDTKSQFNPLQFAAEEGNMELAKFALSKMGCDVNRQDKNGQCALHEAAIHGRVALTKHLLEKAGADIHAKNSDEKSALDLASEEAVVEDAQALSSRRQRVRDLLLSWDRQQAEKRNEKGE